MKLFSKKIISTEIIFLLLVLFSILSLANCKKDEPEVIIETGSGKLKIEFNHTINNQNIDYFNTYYTNLAGNQYNIEEIKYFISDLTLYYSDGRSRLIDDWKAIHYIDNSISETLYWDIYDKIEVGKIDSMSFVFGLNEERNKTFAFVNPPETNMFWPDILGGGYHYLMINGRWKNTQNQNEIYNFHLGIGQIYTDTINYNVNTIVGFVQNYFKITLKTDNLNITKDCKKTIKLNMKIENWFQNPHTWDFNYWGGAIMQNQKAMNTIKENGSDVFRIDTIF